MSHVDPHVHLQQLARRMKELDTLNERKDIEALLDEVEYLCDMLDPEMQGGAEQLMAQLRAKLQQAR